ncbi:L-threonylcarbamoyladenylate synthase [Erythrobacter crassostreae]|uniref:Threonylcarbamoyl-AMP synthase n=1 Tax=Erythrobacter crassostreae TaxID=2828328 RepID=A0A9X1F2R0_9SPHN|nr:L-threonylcarbamoyladenylate synthase [Erythrobacter crassostrea]MBV7258559.1 threonylcarbamoyl-AMP synthase [Erythrobacter crassostrea]
MSGKNVTEVVQADTQGIARAAAILESGDLVAVPTETVYGLAARADNAKAVAKIYAAKGRPDFNPLIVHTRDAGHAAKLAHFDDTAKRLAERYWPGPLTLVLPIREDAALAKAVSAGLPTLAVRVPDHPVMCALLEAVPFPLAAPSANRSGFISPTTAEHVLASLDGRIEMVLDGGATEAGLESTIAAIRAGGRIEELRPGPIQLREVSSDLSSGVAVEAPGQLASHYAPGKPVRLNATKVAPDEFSIGFGDIRGDCMLSASGDLIEAAANLYDCLHQGAASEKTSIAVAPVPQKGIGLAINDRLRRAAAPVD